MFSRKSVKSSWEPIHQLSEEEHNLKGHRTTQAAMWRFVKRWLRYFWQAGEKKLWKFSQLSTTVPSHEVN